MRIFSQSAIIRILLFFFYFLGPWSTFSYSWSFILYSIDLNCKGPKSALQLLEY